MTIFNARGDHPLTLTIVVLDVGRRHGEGRICDKELVIDNRLSHFS
jgi:hypothetical protein